MTLVPGPRLVTEMKPKYEVKVDLEALTRGYRTFLDRYLGPT